MTLETLDMVPTMIGLPVEVMGLIHFISKYSHSTHLSESLKGSQLIDCAFRIGSRTDCIVLNLTTQYV